MRKVALVFMLAVVLPSLVLAGLAWRSLRDQQFVLERQQALLFQGACDSAATQIRELMRAQEGGFVHAVDTLLEDQDVRQIALTFDKRIRTSWPNAETGFAVTLDGNILAPASFDSDSAAKFRRDYESFLSNRVAAEVYPSQWNVNNLASQSANLYGDRYAVNRAEEVVTPPGTNAGNASTGTTISIPEPSPEMLAVNAPPPAPVTLPLTPLPEPMPSPSPAPSAAPVPAQSSEKTLSIALVPLETPIKRDASSEEAKKIGTDNAKPSPVQQPASPEGAAASPKPTKIARARLSAPQNKAEPDKAAPDTAHSPPLPPAEAETESATPSLPSAGTAQKDVLTQEYKQADSVIPHDKNAVRSKESHAGSSNRTATAQAQETGAPRPAATVSRPQARQTPLPATTSSPSASGPNFGDTALAPNTRQNTGSASYSAKKENEADSRMQQSPAATPSPAAMPASPLSPTLPPSPIAQVPSSISHAQGEADLKSDGAKLENARDLNQRDSHAEYIVRLPPHANGSSGATKNRSTSPQIVLPSQQMPSPLPQRGSEPQMQSQQVDPVSNTRNAFPILNESEHQAGNSYNREGNNSYLNLKRSQYSIPRKVKPVKDLDESPPPTSKFAPAEAEFRQLIGNESSGAVALFMQNRLSVLVWYRSPRDPQLVFGAKLAMPIITAAVATGLAVDKELAPQICLAVLDASGRPVARTAPWFETPNWKRPFVATEVGEVLPHWEVAAYLLDPAEMNRAASNLHGTVASLIALMLMAIAVGGWLIAVDLRRQLVLARQKTDFVSNVSHELKTPLTSIRMFSELLQGHRADDPGKRTQFAQIISTEAARLTRLINNVLDFSRMERGEKIYQMEPCDLAQLLRKLMAGYGPQLTTAGYTVKLDLPSTEDSSNVSAVPVYGDADALTQVILNLVSNAEKYGGVARDIHIELKTERTRPSASSLLTAASSEDPNPGNGDAVLRVMDRGPGVPAGAEKAIFEQFYRAHDALNSGIQGSGLGLTLSQQIARAHQGDVTYRQRPGGGSIFTLRLPLSGGVGDGVAINPVSAPASAAMSV